MIHENINDLSASRVELRERIVATAIDAFAKYGIKTITMDDIANTLSISKRTLYEIFQDKESLLMECVSRQQKETEKALQQVLNESENVLEVL